MGGPLFSPLRQRGPSKNHLNLIVIKGNHLGFNNMAHSLDIFNNYYKLQFPLHIFGTAIIDELGLLNGEDSNKLLH